MTGISKPSARICETCKRKEHTHSKDGICHFCWGSCRRTGEMMPVGGELCVHCVFIFPTAPIFCDHGKQFFWCKKCTDEMRACKGELESTMKIMSQHAMWRLDSKFRSKVK